MGSGEERGQCSKISANLVTRELMVESSLVLDRSSIYQDLIGLDPPFAPS
jgi:hypothetical protein